MVRAGYKRTELGEIPDDWDALQLGEIGNFKNGINKPKEAFGSGFPFVNLMDVFGVSKIFSDTKFACLESTEAERNTYNLRSGDVLFIRSSVKPSGVGLTTLIDRDLKNVVFSGFLLRFRDSGKLEHGFKEFCFSDERFRESLIASSTVSANTNINQSSLKKLWLAIPGSNAEQRAIANALSDADALIASLDALIAKKYDLKQAAMQQLLSGKTRLPGYALGSEYKMTEIGEFPKDWGIATLASLSEFITKGSTPTTFGYKWESNGILFLRSECVSEIGLDLGQSMYISAEAHSALRRSEVKDGDILITITGNVGRIVQLSGVGVANLNQHIARIRIVSADAEAGFVYHHLGQPSVRRYYNKITTGQAYPQISLQQVRDTKVPLPLLAEQRAISAVLSDMDDELASLEGKREKARAIKQGMMQELLTGKIRLV